MTTKRTKSVPAARKNAKKTASRPAAKKAPRKPAPKAAPVDTPVDTGPEVVEYVFRGTTYQLQKQDDGYHFGDLTFKALVAFGKHLEKLHGPQEPVAEPDALLEHVETTLAKPPRERTRKTLPEPKEMRVPNDPRVAPGATLTRNYKGAEIKVKVTDDGFQLDGKKFRSLTAVAKHVTGYSAISGTAFFGLWKPTTREGE